MNRAILTFEVSLDEDILDEMKDLKFTEREIKERILREFKSGKKGLVYDIESEKIELGDN